MNRRKTLPANRTPNPSEIHVARRLKAPGGTSLSQTNSIATPTTARMADIVSTPAPAMSTTLTSTSAQANEEAPSTAGPICAMRPSGWGVESLVTRGAGVDRFGGVARQERGRTRRLFYAACKARAGWRRSQLLSLAALEALVHG